MALRLLKNVGEKTMVRKVGDKNDLEASIDESPVTIDMFGCCYTRNTFNDYMDGPFNIMTYLFRLHPFIINSTRPSFLKIEESELIDLANKTTDPYIKRELSHSFIRRNVLYSLNGFPRTTLETKHAEWLVITPYYEDHALLKITDSASDESFYIQTDALPIYKAICNQKGFDLEIINGFQNRPEKIDEFCRWINNTYGDNIILMFGEPAEYRSWNHKEVSEYRDWDHRYLPYIETNFNLLNQLTFCREIIKRIPVHYIDIPFPKVTKDETPVHYEDYVLDYLREMVLNITKGMGNRVEIQLRYKQLAFEIINGQTPIIQNVLDVGEKAILDKRPLNEIFELTDRFMDDYRVQDLIGRAYLNQSPPPF